MRIPVWVVAASVIVMSLLTGVFLGVAIDRRVFLPHAPMYMRTHGRGPGLPHRLASELGLSPAQSASVDSIMRHRMSQRDSLMAHTWPVMRQLLDSTRYDIERILTPEQRAKFEQLRYREFDGPPGMMMRHSEGEGGPVIIRRGDDPPR
jgi:Spy/CpxP family protein refolding chaperone